MPERILTVSDLTADVRGLLEEGFSGIWVEGEISNHRLPGSGHHYFTLKDEFAQLACVLFRGAASRLTAPLRDGLQVQVCGSLTVYEARGQYQLVVQTVQPKGHGELQARFEELKQRLAAEGLFEAGRKKPLPPFPRHIGVVTSPTGAAIRDMLNVFARRAPWLRITIHPARVQGEGAAAEIVEGLRYFNEAPASERPDLVILARGGGSLEDLWAFNEEPVARAIAASVLPVLTGIGHEIDFTIADFASDRREPTPSAAAENATPDGETLSRELEGLRNALDRLSALGLRRRTDAVAAFQRELEARSPARRLRNWAQSLDYLSERFAGATEARLSGARRELAALRRVHESAQPERELVRARERVARQGEELRHRLDLALAARRARFAALEALLRSLGPEATLQRGFSITLGPDGQPVRSAEGLKPGDRLRTRFAEGEATSVVE